MRLLTALAATTVMVAASSPVIAKVRSEATITIHAPIENVWALIVDVDSWPRWNKAVQAARLDGPVAKGSVFNWTSSGLGIRSVFQEVAPYERLSWTGRTFGTRAVHAWALKSTHGGVVVTTTETFDGWLPTLMPGAMQKTLDQTLPALLASLKAAAEHPRSKS